MASTVLAYVNGRRVTLTENADGTYSATSADSPTFSTLTLSGGSPGANKVLTCQDNAGTAAWAAAAGGTIDDSTSAPGLLRVKRFTINYNDTTKSLFAFPAGTIIHDLYLIVTAATAADNVNYAIVSVGKTGTATYFYDGPNDGTLDFSVSGNHFGMRHADYALTHVGEVNVAGFTMTATVTSSGTPATSGSAILIVKWEY